MSDHVSMPVIIGADVGSIEIVIACADTNQAVTTIANNRKAIKAWLKQLPKDAVIGIDLVNFSLRD
jgi:hypothetical protein